MSNSPSDFDCQSSVSSAFSVVPTSLTWCKRINDRGAEKHDLVRGHPNKTKVLAQFSWRAHSGMSLDCANATMPTTDDVSCSPPRRFARVAALWSLIIAQSFSHSTNILLKRHFCLVAVKQLFYFHLSLKIVLL